MRDCTKASWPRRVRSAAAFAALSMGAASLPGACSTPPERPQPEVDCTETVGYEFADVIFTENTFDGQIYWFGFGDLTPGAYDGIEDGVALPGPPEGMCPVPEVINEPSSPPNPADLGEVSKQQEVCNNIATLRLKGNGHKDWGMGWSTVLSARSGFNPPDGLGENQDYQGIAFWGRSLPGHDKTISMVIHTAQSSKPTNGQPEEQNIPGEGCGTVWRDAYGDPIWLVEDGEPVLDEEGHALRDHPDDCKAPVVEEGAATYRMDTNGNLVLSSGAAAPGDCDNPFQRLVTFDNEWQLFLLPFGSFHQLAEPNRDPAGIDVSKIYQFIFRAEKEKDVDIWIDKLRFYREVGWQPPNAGSGEGGAGSITTGAGGAN